jgi:hypothetical protein
MFTSSNCRPVAMLMPYPMLCAAHPVNGLTPFTNIVSVLRFMPMDSHTSALR